MSNHPTLGALIAPDTDARKDAIHVAVAPFIAGRRLLAGAWFKLDTACKAVPADASDALALGIVDPFLVDGVVLKGERFWGCIKPGTTTNLRHEWDHHQIAPAAAQVERVEVIVEKPEDPEVTAVRQFAKDHGLTLEQVTEEASQNLNAECRGCY